MTTAVKVGLALAVALVLGWLALSWADERQERSDQRRVEALERAEAESLRAARLLDSLELLRRVIDDTSHVDTVVLVRWRDRPVRPPPPSDTADAAELRAHIASLNAHLATVEALGDSLAVELDTAVREIAALRNYRAVADSAIAALQRENADLRIAVANPPRDGRCGPGGTAGYSVLGARADVTVGLTCRLALADLWPF